MSGWQPWYSLEMLKASFNVVSSEYQGCHPDDHISATTQSGNGGDLLKSLRVFPPGHPHDNLPHSTLSDAGLGSHHDWAIITQFECKLDNYVYHRANKDDVLNDLQSERSTWFTSIIINKTSDTERLWSFPCCLHSPGCIRPDRPGDPSHSGQEELIDDAGSLLF